MGAKVLISDALSKTAVAILQDHGLDVTFDPTLGKDPERLASVIGDYDAIAIRSATKMTAEMIEKAGRLKVIGRAGIGVDNVDISAASAKGVIVMNTPFGNSTTTAEHAIAMMFALARQIPAANCSTKAGKWEKSRFMGVEVTGKTLGIVGCGNIGSIVAARAQGLQMKVVAFDPFLKAERAVEIGVEKVELDDLLRRSDFISLHTPLNDKTKNLIDAEALAKTRPGVGIINCARGGLIDELALAEALDAGHVAGAALDVFAVEPAHENPLFGHEAVICTPHLGASTREAQENVALQVAEQIADFLVTGAVTNALNSPSVDAHEAPRLKPFVDLANNLGLFAGQILENGITGLRIEYEGEVAAMNTDALTAAIVAGTLRPVMPEVNVVSAPIVAKDHGIAIEQVRRDRQGTYDSYIRLTVEAGDQSRSVAGTVFSDGRPRIIQVKGINLESEFRPHMLFIRNEDKPGFVGRLGALLGDFEINIASFALGRRAPEDQAVALVEVDQDVEDSVLSQILMLPSVIQANRMAF